MKNNFYFQKLPVSSLLLLSLQATYAHADITYDWIGGQSTGNNSGVYGTQGVADASNMPGARNFAVSGMDGNNKTWLFGGYGTDDSSSNGYLNDLWTYAYNSTDSQWEWTWINGSSSRNDAGFYGTKGVASSMNQPPARAYSMQWIDSTNGNIWVFGGNGYNTNRTLGYLNDLWKYNISTGKWTWINGPSTKNGGPTYGTKGTPTSSTIPGARYSSVTWIDESSGYLWLFGGTGYYSSSNKGRLNDLWRYNISTGQWTWISGSNTANTKGTYGTKGTPSSTTVPGARIYSASWKDSSGVFWLYSGYGNDSTTSGVGSLNDLWSYNTTTNQWTWVSGSNLKDQTGVYGTIGVPGSANAPGGRYPLASWVDGSGNFWTFGGLGIDSSGYGGYLNDLWKYNPTSGQWTWSGGPNISDQGGVWGVQGTPSSENIPSSRNGVVSWRNSTTGHLFLMGGYGYNSNPTPALNYLNDLWEIALN